MHALEKNTVALGIKIVRKPRGLFIFQFPYLSKSDSISKKPEI